MKGLWYSGLSSGVMRGYQLLIQHTNSIFRTYCVFLRCAPASSARCLEMLRGKYCLLFQDTFWYSGLTPCILVDAHPLSAENTASIFSTYFDLLLCNIQQLLGVTVFWHLHLHPLNYQPRRFRPYSPQTLATAWQKQQCCIPIVDILHLQCYERLNRMFTNI